MPDFTVIDGGGKGREPHDFEASRAREAFRTLAIELLRALARGDDSSLRVTRALIGFDRHASQTEVPVRDLVEGAIAPLYERAIAQSQDEDEHDNNARSIVEAALRVAAESMATDPAAKGRKSSREIALRAAIEEQILSREKGSRSAGWSYTQNLVSRLGDWPPPKLTVTRAATRVSSAGERASASRGKRKPKANPE